MALTLRDVDESDLAVFFQHQQDSVANYMAAFTAEDPSDHQAFFDHWSRILADDSTLTQSIAFDAAVVGYVATFEQFGEREVTYWVDRAYWNQGIATAALRQFLPRIATRPLYARAAKDNIASRRVLEKCGFVVMGEGSGYANARGQETEEFIFTLV
jgi:RimJ/RimL family protein N-acetyltransferase